MLKKLFCTLFLLFLANPSHAYKVKKFKPLAPPKMQTMNMIQDPNQNVGINENYPKITQLEINLFKKSYEKENIYSRLTRLENKVFKRNFSGMPLASRVDNLLENIDSGIMYGISSKELAKIETKVFGRTYMNDDTESRITRLEKEMIGAMQGGNLKERYNTVKTASKHYNSYPEIAQSQIVYPQSNVYAYNPYNGFYPGTSMRYGRPSGVGNILQSMANRVFRGYGPGMLTGFTPPIYDPYSPYMNPSGIGHQDYYMGNRGGYIRNRNFGNGATIKILD